MSDRDRSGPRLALLIGFDRCGSSMIAGLLGRHPRVNMLFQPFNSTEVTARQWEVWEEDLAVSETEAFFQGLLEGRIEAEYIASDWFENHSTATELTPTGLNVIKDTKLHFKVPWLKARFPGIDLFGIWRDPRAIVCSLMRNDFYARWYGDEAFEEAAGIIRDQPWAHHYREFLTGNLDDTARMALMVAIRTDYLFRTLPPGQWLDYEEILRAPDLILNRFLARWDLEPIDFHPGLEEDHNVAGKPFQREDLWKEYFDGETIAFLDRLFRVMGRS